MSLTPAHLVMQTRQFTNLKRRAEGGLRAAPPEHPIQPPAKRSQAPRPIV